MKPAIALTMLLAACAGDSPAPSATVKTVAPDMLTPSSDELDDLSITLDYRDADGDLGGGIARVQDCRADALVTELAIPTIAPPQAVDDKVHISGEFVVRVNDIGALAPGALPATCKDLGVEELGADRAVFCVTLVDAAGHTGDGDCTQPVALLP